MNKTNLIDAVAIDAGISKAAAKLAVESFMNNVTTTLENGGKVAVVGWGTFSTSVRPKRQGINPKTREKITIPEKTVVKFKAGAAFADAVNK